MKLLTLLVALLPVVAARAADDPPAANNEINRASRAQRPLVEEDAGATPPKPPAAPPKSAPSDTQARKIKLVGGVFFNSASDLKFANGTMSGGGQSASLTADYQTDTAQGVSLEARQSEPYSWGYSLGGSYEFKRNIKSATLTSNGISASASYPTPPTLAVLQVEGNAIYRWDRFYLPFGLNYSIPSFERGAGATGTFEISGSFGAQLGVGFYCTDSISLQLMSKAEAFTAKGSNLGYSYDFGTGYLTGVDIQLTYAF